VLQFVAVCCSSAIHCHAPRLAASSLSQCVYASVCSISVCVVSFFAPVTQSTTLLQRVAACCSSAIHRTLKGVAVCCSSEIYRTANGIYNIVFKIAYIFTCVCIYAYIYICVCAYTFTQYLYIFIYTCNVVFTHTHNVSYIHSSHVYMCACAYICILYAYICLYTYIIRFTHINSIPYARVYVRVHIYTHTM